MKKLTLSEVKKRLSAINPDISVLDDIYINDSSYLHLHCKLCNNFWRARAKNLLRRNTGCPKCSVKRRAKTRSLGINKVVKHLLQINPNIKVLSGRCANVENYLYLTCIVCGNFWQASVKNLLYKQTRCPRCAKKESKVEIDFLNAFEGWAKDRKILSGKELDAYFAKEKLAIEINGCFWHSTYQTRITKNYHLDKTNICEQKGIKLLHFWDFEIKEGFEFCRQVVLENLGLLNDIDDFDTREIEPLHFILYDSNDIKRSSLKLKHTGSNSYEIVEFSGSNKQNLYDYFVSKYKPLKIKAILNRRFHSIFDNYALKLGFKLDKITKPNYFHYLNKGERRFSKAYAKAKNLPRCYDCGELVYKKEYLCP